VYVRAVAVVFLLDLDNTLCDNDLARERLATATERVLGPDLSADYWRTYESVRDESGFVDFPRPGAVSNASTPARRTSRSTARSSASRTPRCDTPRRSMSSHRYAASGPW